MKKATKMVGVLVLAAGVCALLFACRNRQDSSREAGGNQASPEKVALTMGSWRHEDTVQVGNMLAEYSKIKPNVEIQFRPTNAPDYNATLRLQLESGTGPDLMYARSYATGQELFSAGYFGDCSDIPGVTANFTGDSLAPWQMPDGKLFAVPFAAVSHAVYYNKTIFQKEGLSVPQTWEDFLALCQTLASKGYTPLANGIADEWDILECFFLGNLPNLIGGASERAQYESGAKKLNDANFIAAFQAMADVAKYLPRGYEAVTYNDSQALFSTQQAVMSMDVSATLKAYADVPFEWGIFALPAPRGRATFISFHPDMAIAYNKAGRHTQEAREFLAWLATKEGVAIAARNMPDGFFPMINAEIGLENPHAREFLELNNGRGTDVRFLWPRFMELYTPMNQAVINVLAGQLTPAQAAGQMETEAAKLR
jgi:raffinose/stachyose/melibiose transport system substrate-binding protein